MLHSEATFEALLETAPDAVVVVDAGGRVVFANAQVEALFGYTRTELIGQPVEWLVPESARAVHPAHREGYFADPHPRPMGAGMQLAARRKDGSEFPAEISLSSIQTDAGVVVSAAVRDITERIEARTERERLRAQSERKRAEVQLHQSHRLESLGQLAGGIAHDFNNLLAVILNYTAFIGEKIDRAALEDPARWKPVRRDLDQVRRAAERTEELTHQLLAFGRREVVRPQALDLNDVIEGVEPILRRTLGEHIELRIDRSPDLWPIMADPGQLEQVLVNLAINARDAMPGGGTLRIDTANVTTDDTEDTEDTDGASATPQRFVSLRVCDTGMGMSAEVAERAFEPFFTTKRKDEGSGLGLATVHGIVTQAGGQAELTSAVGAGTSFRARFPVTGAVAHRDESVPGHPTPEHRSPQRAGGETVLVVEDQHPLRELTRRLLTRNGHTVLSAAGGDEAIELAEQHPGEIHLLLTDVIMPRMLGRDVAERVSALRPGIGVLYTSGYAQPVLASKGTLDEGVALLEKPFSEADLLARVRQVLDGDG